MNAVTGYFRELFEVTKTGWNRFWFTPSDPATLAVIRILTGGMLLYTHAVWTIDLAGFFGPHSRISPEFVNAFHGTPWAWSFWTGVHSSTAMWLIHIVALAIFTLMMIGLWTPVTTVLSFLLATSYAHRATGALFGLDQINLMLAMYLMIGDAGGAYSMDACRRRRHELNSHAVSTIRTTIAIRLMQLHLCVIYFFAALGKLQGESWWDGMAMWLALANYEYQSIDMTFLARWPIMVNLLTHISLLWELSYCVLVWPRWTRPLVLALAVPLHGGIALCMGMITFGVIMLVANLAFVSPQLIRAVFGSLAAVPSRSRRPKRKQVARSGQGPA